MESNLTYFNTEYREQYEQGTFDYSDTGNLSRAINSEEAFDAKNDLEWELIETHPGYSIKLNPLVTASTKELLVHAYIMDDTYKAASEAHYKANHKRSILEFEKGDVYIGYPYSKHIVIEVSNPCMFTAILELQRKWRERLNA